MPQAPSWPLLKSHSTESRRLCRKKRLDEAAGLWQQSGDVEVQNISFCGWHPGAGQGAFSLKQQQCPHCGCAESLNRHSKLYGNDPEQVGKRAERGQRVFCSDRGQRGGCGRTFSIFLAQVLPRHTVRAGALWSLLQELLSGVSIQASTQKLRLPFALESVYGWVSRLRGRLDGVRVALCRRQKAPESSQSDPLLQTVEHLQGVFSSEVCAVSEVQVVFQQALLG